MGTRHRQAVIAKDGTLRISQYGQWDGYPSGQGANILDYLKKGNLEKYQANLNKIEQITDTQITEVEKTKDWDAKYPYLSRDCGARIHQMIEDGEVQFVDLISEDEANRWCEGFYTIDFSKNLFTSEFHGQEKSYPLDKLPTKEQYLKDTTPKED